MTAGAFFYLKGETMTQKEWIGMMVPLAKAAQEKFGYLASVLVAQACLENGYGMDASCEVLTQANNVLGMKRELLNDTWESDYWNGDYITKKTPEWDGGIHYIDDDFRKYKSLQDCFFDYCQFMRDARYSQGGTYKYRDVLSMTDPETLITTVAGRGYCTDPDYPKSLMAIIKKHDLTQYDKKPTVARTVRSILAGLGKTLVDLIATNRSEVPQHNANSHKYLAVHYLGVDNADNPYLYGGGYGGHFYVPIDGRKAYQAALVTDQLWHVGASSKNGYKYIHPDARNKNTIGIEIGTFKDNEGRWQFTEAAQETAAELAAAILMVYNIPFTNLLRHGDVTTKCCPAPLMPASREGSEGAGTNWTWQKFRNRVAELMGEIADTTYAATVLSRGSQGDEVKELQEGLILLGYSCGKSGADGDFGKDTEKAVKRFQADQKLMVDGSAGPETLGILKKLHAVAMVQDWLNALDGAGLTVDGDYGPKTKKALITLLQRCLVNVYGARIKIDGDFGPETKAACRAVAKGDKGILVSILQASLMVNGIWETRIDASFGDLTEKAVREFQEKACITVDGSAGPETFGKLLG